MSVCCKCYMSSGKCYVLSGKCYVLSGRGLCDELITHPEESWGLLRQKKNINIR